jgi:hypothetical protein
VDYIIETANRLQVPFFCGTLPAINRDERR